MIKPVTAKYDITWSIPVPAFFRIASEWRQQQLRWCKFMQPYAHKPSVQGRAGFVTKPLIC